MSSSAPSLPDRASQIYAEQVRLLYTNGYVGLAVSAVAVPLLVLLLWGAVPRQEALIWLAAMTLITAGRGVSVYRYWRLEEGKRRNRRWGRVFTAGSALAGAGWGTASILLFASGSFESQVFLLFVLGGVMLSAGSLLAARPEAYLPFLVLTGVPGASRLFFGPGAIHAGMGAFGLLFTGATMATTWRIHRTVRSALTLKFEKRDLVESLQREKRHTESLNLELERRVERRTSELHQSNRRLLEEMEQRRQAEEELVRSRKLEALAVLAGGIAHDFNNILTVVQGNASLAREGIAEGTAARHYLDQTLAACDRAATLASPLLSFSKGGDPVRRVTRVDQVVKQAAEAARGAKIPVDAQIAGGLWAAEIDGPQVSQAIHNILLNANQSMPEGGLVLLRAENVMGGAGNRDRFVCLSVRDEGCGMAPDILPRIFDPYFTTKQGGRGLGLSAAYSIITRHNGRITVESAPGRGTTVRVYLPACDIPVPEERPGETELSRGTGRILVMDDDEPLRNLLVKALSRLGYEVESAGDGAEALAVYSAGRFDAVLLDLAVPGGMGGTEAAARLRAVNPHVKLIVSSGYSDAPVMADFRRYGFDAVIRKPWTLAQLAEVVGTLVGGVGVAV